MACAVFFWSLILITLSTQSLSSDSVSQSPRTVIRRPGQSVDMNCTQSSSNTYMYWYQQKTNGPLRFVFSTANSEEAKEKGDGIPDRFTVSRRSIASTALKMTSVEGVDTAVYYCASSPQCKNMCFLLSKNCMELENT